MAEKFDAVIVGAGPAGCAAAYALARENLRVLVLERGECPGAKNTSGALLHTHGLVETFPGFMDEAPVERIITSRKIAFLSEGSSTTVEFADQSFAGAVTVLRAKFDQWLAGKAEAAGALIMSGAQVDDLIMDGDKTLGVKTRMAGGEVQADVVVIAEGANSILTEKAGLGKKLDPGNMAVAAKELIKLPAQTIRDRFHLSGNQGAAIQFVGQATKGVPGGGFIYANRESLSLGLVCRIKELAARRLKISELIELFKAHPQVAPLVRGGQIKEYSGHMIPEGGHETMPGLFAAGVLVVGEAACLNFNNGLLLRGMDYAIASGLAAAKAVARAHERGDFSASALSAYQQELQASFVLKDLARFRKLPDLLANPRIYSTYPDLAAELGRQFFAVDGSEQKRLAAIVWETARQQDVSTSTIVKDLVGMGIRL